MPDPTPPPASAVSLRLGVVVNPTAGKGRGARVGRGVVDRLVAAGHDVWDLSGHSADLALEHARRAVTDGLDALVVVGGDGMVHLGVQAVAGTPTPLGIVAVGTGNDFATKLGLPVAEAEPTVTALLTALAAGAAGVRTVDAIEVTGTGLSDRRQPDEDAQVPVRWVAGAVSAGLDAAVNERANAMLRPKGASRYVVAALREIAAYRAWRYRLTFEHVQGDAAEFAAVTSLPGFTDLGAEPDGDGRRLLWDAPGALVTASNGSTIGGGIPVAPEASIDDGLLDVVLAGDVGRGGACVLFPLMLAGRHLGSRRVRVVRARAVVVEPGEGAGHLPSAFGDGEHLGTLPVRAELRAGALRVLVPPVG
ncbi:diacylglycerol kinase catalytic region [Xylanimonas cellulosilytica DSM 15894]|uniref:Diacylglycerol kinase catalytic region n=1 Tax=Xylanimonas cellulosilytica (strain DSM 15894 / JCM 12276 / CECT 5975 / KCTC 9989 / LMG 20990 / NBRC 107835 / XIL07) TaxID=446471 RepID=D1BSV6_XYLCX|nr:diacylglycerol kinase family protein [Xylanimonas cellulosilytica]ACZ30798.1 diacylglycerol kinase catalytic region [Xylanimonas cellulosilytica DSM 15894]